MQKFLSIFIVMTLFQCKCPMKNNNNPSPTPSTTMEKDSKIIKNQEGIIGYWESLKKYTINYNQPNTYDGQYTCIIEGNLNEEYKKQGISVVFSGTIYKNAETPQPMIGGQQVFWLKLDSIKIR
jgi:hypothetical protein